MAPNIPLAFQYFLVAGWPAVADDKNFFRLDRLNKLLLTPDIVSRIDSLGVPIKRFGLLVKDRDVLDLAGRMDAVEASEHAHKILDIARAIFEMRFTAN